jgi:hypothetical protein
MGRSDPTAVAPYWSWAQRKRPRFSRSASGVADVHSVGARTNVGDRACTSASVGSLAAKDAQ